MKSMFKQSLAVVFVLLDAASQAQCSSSWRDSLDAYWSRMDAEFSAQATSPLDSTDRIVFEHLQRFTPEPSYCVKARFTPAEGAEPFTMKTSTARLPVYKANGTLRFTLNGKEWKLTVYESVPPHPGYENELFLPFTDLTNGEETYGAGRYLDLHGPLAAEVELDFNKAYNPYCAYSHRYSCPIPPKENHLATRIRAGVLKFHE